MENIIDNSREYMYIFKEQFDLLDILTDSQFARLFRMIRDLRFRGIDTKVQDIDDVTLKGIWLTLRTQVLTSAKNARHHRKRKSVETDNATPTNEPVETTPILPNVEIDDKVKVEKKDVKLKFLLRNFAEYGKETDRFLSKYANERHSPDTWNTLIKNWEPESENNLLPECLNRFLRRVYKRALVAKDKEIDKMLTPQILNYNPESSLLLIRCPQECLDYWQRNITPNELSVFGNAASVKYECLR